jgi:hypothetical protein
MKYSKNLIYILIIIFILFSCEVKDSNILSNYENQKEINEVFGLYQFEYPSGEVELVRLNEDYSYLQFIFKNNVDVEKRNEPIYKNKNVWKYNSKEIEFKSWLVYCDYNNPKMVKLEPSYEDLKNVYWVSPGFANSVSILDIYSENGYFFKKIE